MNQKEAIDKLNSEIKVRLAPSKVHGIGVFALQDLYVGEKLHADTMPNVYKIPYGSYSKIWPEVGDLIRERWPSVVNGEPFMMPEALMIAYMNHSENPNYSNTTDLILKDVKKGEEVFENYKDIPNWEVAFPFLIK